MDPIKLSPVSSPQRVSGTAPKSIDQTTAFKDAFAHWTNGHVEMAKANYEEIRTNDPENKEARYFLNLLEKQKIADPMEHFNRLHQRQSLPPTLVGYIHWTGGDYGATRVPVFEEFPWDHREELHTIGLMFLDGSALEQSDAEAARFLSISGDKGKQKLEEMYLQDRCITKHTLHKAITYLVSIHNAENTINKSLTAFLLGKLFLASEKFSLALQYLNQAGITGFSDASDLEEKTLRNCSRFEGEGFNPEDVENFLKMQQIKLVETTPHYADIILARQSGADFASDPALQEWCKTNPETRSVTLKNALSFEKKGAHEMAKMLYEAVLQDDPDNPEARRYLKLTDLGVTAGQDNPDQN